jgi:hypothetical protein
MTQCFLCFQAKIENLQLVVEANKKQDSAVDVLRVELERKSSEKIELVSGEQPGSMLKLSSLIAEVVEQTIFL